MIFTLYSFLAYLPFILVLLGTVIYSVYNCVKSWTCHRNPGLPKLYFKDSILADFLLKECSLLNRKFNPPWWLRNAHVQTVISYLFPVKSVQFDREYVQMDDKGVVALDWVKHLQEYKRKQSTILLIVPGITANATSVTKLCSYATNKGFRPVVFNQRGFGNSVLTTPKILSTGDPSDLRQVVQYISGLLPKPIITMIGYGTGCSLVLSYLGEYGSSANISAAVCISACYDPAQRFSNGLKGLYDFVYILRLKLIFNAHSSALSKYVNFSKMLRTWNFKDLETLVYSNMYDFKNIDEFWVKNNPLRDVDEIAVPMLFINSLDDPFYSRDTIPFDIVQHYPHFFMVASTKGGHCGFIENIYDVSWSDSLALDYIDSVLDYIKKGYKINYGKNKLRSTI